MYQRDKMIMQHIVNEENDHFVMHLRVRKQIRLNQNLTSSFEFYFYYKKIVSIIDDYSQVAEKSVQILDLDLPTQQLLKHWPKF